jgi:hypothetical protein
MHNDLERAIEKELQKLRKTIHCNDCPEDRHCCVFENDYGLRMTKKTAKLLFGDDIPALEVEGRLTSHGRYMILQNGKCPLLSEQMTCSVHDKKEAVGLTSCVKYPIFLGKDNNMTRLVIDYRCTHVENNWNTVRTTAQEIIQNLCDTVVVYRNNGKTYQQPLAKFDDYFADRKPMQEK